jgi:hypothetical protein
MNLANVKAEILSFTLAAVSLAFPFSLHAASRAVCVFETFPAPPGYTLSQVQGVDDEGGVVGQVVNNKSLKFVAFTRAPGGAITLYAAPQSSSTWLYGRNGVGIESGFYQDSQHPEQVHGFQVQSGKFVPVNYPKFANTWLFNANLLGAAVGSFSSSAALVRGFLLLNGNYTIIAYPDARTTYALAINDSGDVIGTYASGRVSNGFLWKDGSFTTINYPNAKYGTVLTGLNNAGVIVGNHLSNDRDLGFILENGEYKDVVYPTANYTTVGGINNNHLISGQIHLADTSSIGYTAMCQ